MNANPSPARRGGSNDSQRAVDLRRVKFAATAALGGCLALLVIARSFEGRHPALGYLAAFAEAAVIGGLADWYAVVALFRHPLGLRIPHTAIIPSNQQLIAEKLGEFIEEEPSTPRRLKPSSTRPTSPRSSANGSTTGSAAAISRGSC